MPSGDDSLLFGMDVFLGWLVELEESDVIRLYADRYVVQVTLISGP